jgi:hypothetical protein
MNISPQQLLIWIGILVSLNSQLAASQDDEDYYNKFSVCDGTSVVVSDISIVCDSPGTYYYGSGKYRNSATCQAGDKAKMQVNFDILEDLEADAYLTLYVQAYGTIESVMLHAQESLCSVVQTNGNGVVCPQAGSYKIYETFYWGSQNDEYEYTFTPKVVVGLASALNSKVYDVGGANTNKCSGGVVSDWTTGIRKSMANSIKSFVATFGILSAGILAIALAAWCIVRQARARRKVTPQAIIVDEDLDDMSYKAIRDNQTLVDV